MATCFSATSAHGSISRAVIARLARGRRADLRSDRRSPIPRSASPMPSPPTSSTASCCPRADGRFLLVAPAQVRANRAVRAYVDRLLASGGPIAELLTFDLKESMENGGGPACLRLRVALTERRARGDRRARVPRRRARRRARRLDPAQLPRSPRAGGSGRSGAPRRVAPRARRAHADPAAAIRSIRSSSGA